MDRAADSPELLDGALDPDILAGNLRDLTRVNRWLGGTALTRHALITLLRDVHRASLRRVAGTHCGGQPITLLDVGTGAADIPETLVAWMARRGVDLRVVAIDPRREILHAAFQRVGDRHDLRLDIAQGDRLAYEAGAFDVVHASLVMHHLEPGEAARLIAEMARVSRVGVIVNDLDRSRLGWLGALVISRLFTRNPYTRHDAPLSVRRAYRPSEVARMASRAGLVEVARARGFLGHRYALAFAHAPMPADPAHAPQPVEVVAEARAAQALTDAPQPGDPAQPGRIGAD